MGWWVGVCLALAVLYGSVWGPSTAQASQKRFSIVFANISKLAGVYRLDATVNYVLSRPAREALLNGVRLEFELEINILQKRDWLPTAKAADLDQRYQLSYHALSQQFVVENINAGVHETFPELDEALRYMGEVIDLPLIDASLLSPGKKYICEIRARLDLDRLPLPLMIRAYASPSWWLRTDWYTLKLP
jgi:hypothetical protein